MYKNKYIKNIYIFFMLKRKRREHSEGLEPSLPKKPKP